MQYENSCCFQCKPIMNRSPNNNCFKYVDMLDEKQSKPILSRFDLIIEVAALLVLFGMWIAIGVNYMSLPESIPSFSRLGGSSRAENRLLIVFLGALATIVFWAISALINKPYLFYSNKPLTAVQYRQLLTIVLRMYRCLKLSFALVFLYIVLEIMATALEKHFFPKVVSSWIIPILLNVPVIFFLIASIKVRMKS